MDILTYVLLELLQQHKSCDTGWWDAVTLGGSDEGERKGCCYTFTWEEVGTRVAEYFE
jgi:hypothetical protein